EARAAPTSSPSSSATHQRSLARSGSARISWRSRAALAGWPGGCDGRRSSATASTSSGCRSLITRSNLDVVPSAAIVTIGNEIVSGAVENTNASWLARRLEQLGLPVRLTAAIPDDVEPVAAFVRSCSEGHDAVVVTGGLGGTPDDVTREAIAAAFGVD